MKNSKVKKFFFDISDLISKVHNRLFATKPLKFKVFEVFTILTSILFGFSLTILFKAPISKEIISIGNDNWLKLPNLIQIPKIKFHFNFFNSIFNFFSKIHYYLYLFKLFILLIKDFIFSFHPIIFISNFINWWNHICDPLTKISC